MRIDNKSVDVNGVTLTPGNQQPPASPPMGSFGYRPPGYRPWSTSPPSQGDLRGLDLIAFTGAGVGKASGVPTFAERPWIRNKLTRTYADEHPADYIKMIAEWSSLINSVEPNDAHRALAEYNVPVVTMNVDGLHARAGSTDLIEVHGRLPDVVLYGDGAPRYADALKLLANLEYRRFVVLIVGVSGATAFAEKFIRHAGQRAFSVITINANAEVEVRANVERLRAGVCKL